MMLCTLQCTTAMLHMSLFMITSTCHLLKLCQTLLQDLSMDSLAITIWLNSKGALRELPQCFTKLSKLSMISSNSISLTELKILVRSYGCYQTLFNTAKECKMISMLSRPGLISSITL